MPSFTHVAAAAAAARLRVHAVTVNRNRPRSHVLSPAAPQQQRDSTLTNLTAALAPAAAKSR